MKTRAHFQTSISLRTGLYFVFILILASNLNAQNKQISMTRHYFTWPTTSFHIELSQSIVRSEPLNRLSAVSKSQPALEEHFVANFPDSIKRLVIDSKTVISDLFDTYPELTNQLQDLARSQASLVHAPDRNLAGSTLVASVPVFPELASLFLQHNQTIPLARVYAWQPKAEYTGLIIYMAEALPWFGIDGTTMAQAALFPKIYDQRSRLVLNIEYIEANFAKKWGSSGYAQSIYDAQKNEDRIGANPYIISANAVFGKIAVDPVISEADADLLLYSETSRKALREGRVIIVLSKDALTKNWQ